MKRFLFAAALVLSCTLPLTVAQTTVAAANWFQVNNPGSWVDLYTEPGYRKGRLQCRIPHGNYLETGSPSPGANPAKVVDDKVYYHVYWKRKFGVMEWHWRDAMNNRWCPHWNRHGWAEGDLLRQTSKPGGLWIN